MTIIKQSDNAVILRDNLSFSLWQTNLNMIEPPACFLEPAQKALSDLEFFSWTNGKGGTVFIFAVMEFYRKKCYVSLNAQKAFGFDTVYPVSFTTSKTGNILVQLLFITEPDNKSIPCAVFDMGEIRTIACQ